MLLAVLLVAAAALQDAPDVLPLAVPAGERSALSSLARGADGVVRLSWVERGEDGTARLWLAPFEGDAFGAPVAVAAGDDWFLNWADFPTTAALSDGTLAAAWLRRLGAGTYAYGVTFALSTDDGATWSEPAWLHTDRSPSEHGFVSLVALDDDRFLAVWLDGRDTPAARGEAGEHGHGHAAGDDAGAMALWSRTVARDGTLGPEVRVDARVCDCCQTTLVATGDGTAVAAWRDRSDDEVRDVAWARYADGAWSAPRTVHADGWELPGCPVNGPQLAAFPTGLACVWHTGAGRPGTYVAFLGDQGSAALDAGLRPAAKQPGFGPALRVDTAPSEGRVDAVALGDGRLLVTWLEHTDDGVRWRARTFGADGAPGPAFDVAATDSDRRSGFLRAAALPSGILVTWTDREAARVRAARVVPGR